MPLRFLPQLDQELQPPMPNAGADFGAHGGGLSVLSKYSAALVVSHGDVPTERLKSVPSPWARLLLFEQALFSDRHPAHERIVQEWRGLLGCIGLSKHLGLQVEVRPVDITESAGAVRHLRAMAPVDQTKEIWDRLALLYIDGQLAGGTSPRTLVFTGIRPGQTGDAPFQRDGRLSDPVEHYRSVRDRDALALLAEWIGAMTMELRSHNAELQRLLGSIPAGQNAQPISRAELLMMQLDRWADDARRALDEIGRPRGPVVRAYSSSVIAAAFPTDHPAAQVFACIRCVEAADGVGTGNELTVDGLGGVADPGRTGRLLKDGQPFSGDVALPRGMTRRVLNGRFVQMTTAAAVAATWPDLETLFAERLIPVAEIRAESARGLSLGALRYLYPFKPELLDIVPAERLGGWITAEGDPATEITVRLSIPLQSGLQLEFRRTYSASDILRDDRVTTPLLTEWPDFEAPGWTHYYYHVRQLITASTPLWFEPHVQGQLDTYADDPAGLRWGCASTAPRTWIGRHGQSVGLLLAIRRPAVNASSTPWDVSVDFGSTHTRVFRSSAGVDGRATTAEVQLTPRVRTLLGDDNQLAYHFFGGQVVDSGSNAEPPSLLWLPLPQVTARASAESWLPSDGIMFWGSLQDAPNLDGLRGNLKWHRDDPRERAAFHSYVSQLYLAIAAEATARGATVTSLITAYPSVLPVELRHRHRQEWGQVARRFNVQLREPRPESDAVASFLIERQGAAVATNLLAVDVGGSTSDIAVWTNSRRAYSDSVRLAGDILSRLVASDYGAREAISAAVQRPPFNTNGVVWEAANGSRNGLLFNSLLRDLSKNPVFREERDVLAKNLNSGQGSAGERLLSHLAYLFATTSFFLGMAVKSVGLRADRYDIRFAGKGAEFLHWLEALSTGASRTLPANFFRAGAELTNEQVQVTPPGSEAKQEVGRGLLVQLLEQQEEHDERVTIVGEDGFKTGGRALGWADNLGFDVLRAIEVPAQPRPLETLKHLTSFIGAFQSDPASRKAARALGLVPASLNVELRDRIHNELFGPGSAWNAVRNADREQEHRSLLEPFFITEAKILLEHLTGNHDLF
jgi:hypothetical protein